MTKRHIALLAGCSYLIIFVTAIYGNFFVLEALLADPLGTVTNAALHVRLGVLAFLVAAVCDVVVAWALNELYKGHIFTQLSTYFRVLHAGIMGLAVFALMETLSATSSEAILEYVVRFNTLWLIGLFFFGFHLMLLAQIVKHIRFIPWMLFAAGAMYVVDTSAHFLLANYATYADVFLLMVAVPSIAGEMLFSLWLLYKGGKSSSASTYSTSAKILL